MRSILFFCFLSILNYAVLVNAQEKSADDKMFGYQLVKAIPSYEKALTKGDSSVLPKLADASFYDGRFKDALKWYRLIELRGDTLSLTQKRNHVHAAFRTGMPSPYYKKTDYFSENPDWKFSVREALGNSQAEDLSPFYRNGLLLFSSSREYSGNKNKFRYPLTGLPYLDIHLMDTNGVQLKLKGLPSDINSELHDGPVYLTTDSNWLFVTRTRSQPSEDGIQQLYLTIYSREKGKWIGPIEFPYNQQDVSVQHPWYDEKNQVLFFSANYAGGIGGFDLYKSPWREGKWQKPENLGSEINSPFDEVFPALTDSLELAYATNHIETMGGLDMVLFRNGKRYLLPEPLNSLYDDYGLVFSGHLRGYLSTNRLGQRFDDDLFAFEGEEYVKVVPIPRFKQYLQLVDAQTGLSSQLPGVRLALKSSLKKDSTVIANATGENLLGNFVEPLPSWSANLDLEGYYPFSGPLTFEAKGDSFVARINIVKKKPVLEANGFLAIYFQNGEPRPITADQTETLDYSGFFAGYMKGKPVYYQRSASSKQELDAFFADVEKGMYELTLFPARLDTVLQTGRRMKVYMAAYTSASGSAAINKAISERRGLVLKNYIVNWNNGALKKYIDNGQLTVSDEYFPMSDPNEGKKAKPAAKAGPEVTMFGVPASRNRRVNVVWETLSDDKSAK